MRATVRRHTRLAASLTAAALVLTACGGTDTEDAGAEASGTEEEMSGSDMSDEEMGDDEMSDDMSGDMEMSEGEMDGMSDDEMDGMDHGGMDMGSADLTVASERDGELVSGDFALLDSAPDSAAITGTADLARLDDMTVVTLDLEGLTAGAEYVSHVHAAPCSEDGGPHYMHDPEGGDTPPNEIHLAFTGTEDGAITWTVENPQVANDDAVSVVIHEEGGPKLACADLA